MVEMNNAQERQLEKLVKNNSRRNGSCKCIVLSFAELFVLLMS